MSKRFAGQNSGKAPRILAQIRFFRRPILGQGQSLLNFGFLISEFNRPDIRNLTNLKTRPGLPASLIRTPKPQTTRDGVDPDRQQCKLKANSQ